MIELKRKTKNSTITEPVTGTVDSIVESTEEVVTCDNLVETDGIVDTRMAGMASIFVKYLELFFECNATYGVLEYYSILLENMISNMYKQRRITQKEFCDLNYLNFHPTWASEVYKHYKKIITDSPEFSKDDAMLSTINMYLNGEVM